MDTKGTASQKEVRNMLLKISGRGMPLIYWKTMSKFVSYMCMENRTHKWLIWSFIKEISKQNIEGLLWFIIGNYSKMQGGKRNWGKSLNKKELGLKCLDNSQPIQMAKDAKIKKFLPGVWHREIAKGVTARLDFLVAPGIKKPACQCRRHRWHRLDPWVGKMPWMRAQWPTPVFFPGESRWTEEPGGPQSMGQQRVERNWSNCAFIHPRDCITTY